MRKSPRIASFLMLVDWLQTGFRLVPDWFQTRFQRGFKKISDRVSEWFQIVVSDASSVSGWF